MKILTDIRLLSRGASSGIGEYAHSLLKEMLAGDERNEYLLFYNALRKAPLPLEIVRDNARLISWGMPNKLFDIGLRFFREPKLERFYDFDAAWSPHFNILETKKPRVITFHDLSFIHHPDFFSLKQRAWHWLQNCRAQAQSATSIIAVSEFTKSDLVEMFQIPEQRVKVIYSGISGEFKALPENDETLHFCRKKYGLQRPFILYFGTREPRKNISALIRAFDLMKQRACFRDFELVIAGNVGWLYDEVVRNIKNSPAREHIRLLGGVPRGERVPLYNLSSLFVYPSFFEGFGFPPLEAQACGIPVVASNRTSLPEILGESAILVDPWRVDELADAMGSILESEEVRKKYIHSGFANVKKFNWESTARATVATLEEAVQIHR